MIKLSWASLEYSNIDGMTRFKKKLQDLKVIIRHWVKTKRLEMVGSKLDTIAELKKIDKAMDIGVVDDSTVLCRLELKNNLLKLTKMEAKDRIQKSKVLANRLVSVIEDLVSDTQSAFVAGRQILDGPFILDEILKWCKRMKKQAMFFKVDFAKAYDSVSCDPLAPYVFILVMKSLHLSFSRVVEEDLFKGIQLPRSISISHIFYEDDAMFIGEWSDNNLKVPRGVLKALESIRNRFFNGRINWIIKSHGSPGIRFLLPRKKEA
nr:putative RNA-directed DNA polymerase, eukaryota, reverse transcriptase zinc-binding domain protein [Tanacetum cinerariifolium]